MEEAKRHAIVADARKGMRMITGTHVIIYTKDAEADRALFHDVLGFRSVDADQGCLIFALPPSEASFHLADQAFADERGLNT
jgi:hypothetical protein